MDTYIDDVFRALKIDREIERRKTEMAMEWEIKDVRKNKYFLGTQVQQDLHAGIIKLTQQPYWEHIIKLL